MSVTIKTIRHGDGKTFPEIGDKVACHHTLKLKGGKMIDTTRDGKPYCFRVGKGRVIEGWDMVIPHMSVGQIAEVNIPPKYGYGACRARPMIIPPNAHLTFEIELLGIKPSGKRELRR